MQLDIHNLVNPASDHFHIVPSGDHYRTETVLPPSDHYCIAIVAPSGDHYCIDLVVPSSEHCFNETVLPSSDHYGTSKVAPPSDHLHTKKRKLVGEKTFTKSLEAPPQAKQLRSAQQMLIEKIETLCRTSCEVTSVCAAATAYANSQATSQ